MAHASVSLLAKTGGRAGTDGGMVKFGEVSVKFSKKNFTAKYADISAKFVNVVKLVKFFGILMVF